MKYLEIDSTYRNRNEWPGVAQFEIPISQTGRKGRYGALDPVCNSTPSIEVWTSNNLDKRGKKKIYGEFTNLFNVTPNSIYICVDTSTGQFLQGAFNYYRNLDLYFLKAGLPYYTLKIAGYSYMGRYSVSGKDVDIGAIYLLVIPTEFDPTDTFEIIDPTNFDNNINPTIYVPFADGYSNPILNNYNNYILYNETINEYRPIKYFDSVNSILSLITLGEETYTSGPVINWKSDHSFSIRYKPPLIPSPGNSSLIIEESYTHIPSPYSEPITYTTNESRLVLSGSTVLAGENSYKNCAVRITKKNYNYDFFQGFNILPYLKPPTNQSIIITHDISYEDKNTGKIYLIIQLLKPLDGVLTTGYDSPYRAEILDFSYDNYNPFVYNGSVT